MIWQVILLPVGDRHVLPQEDLRPHEAAESCWCRPTDDDGVWVHHAMDRREAIEEGEQRQ